MMNKRLTAALIAAAVAAIPLNAFAEDWGRVLSDPNYLPLTGELDGTSAYTYGMLQGDSFDGTGAKTSSFHADTNRLMQSFDYGITGDFSVGASVAYDPSVHRKVDLTGGPSSSKDSSGFEDPAINATWRVMDERNSPMIFDLFASYSPDFVKAQIATPSDDGTLGRGGQSATIGAALGREWQNFGIRASASAIWLDNRTLDVPGSASSHDLASSWNYALGVTAQERFTDRLSLNFGGDYDFRQSYATSDAVLGANWTTHPGNVGSLHAALNYHFVPNRFVGSLTYQYNGYNHGSNKDATPTSFDSSLRNQNENIIGARLAYVLN